MPQPASLHRLLDTVVEGGFCIGCGACAALPGSPLELALDANGRLQARLTDGAAAIGGLSTPAADAFVAVCPFSDAGAAEDDLAAARFLGDAMTHDPRIGRYARIWVGHVTEDAYRAHGAAGGMGTWILTELMRRRLVDGIIHVASTPGEERLFRYRVSHTPDEVWGGSRSAYYPVEMSQVLREVRDSDRRYALIGIPCFVKAVRLLGRADPVIDERIPFTLGLFSDHLKSTAFAEALGWQVGIPPGALRSIDFRTQLHDRPANRYGMTAEGPDGAVVRPMTELLGGDWGLGLFKYKACDHCDDISAEVADVAIGDAWLPGYAEDAQGTNVVIVRNPALVAMFEEAIAAGRVALEPLSADDVVRSQAANHRHRREMLPDRLAVADEREDWRPPKRLSAAPGPPETRARNAARQRLREQGDTAMAEARAEGRVDVLAERLAGAIAAYRAVSPTREAAADRRGRAGEPGRPTPSAAAPSREAPIFIVGVARSGTTLLRAMLTAHSRLDCGPETHVFARISRADERRIVADPLWPSRAVETLAGITVGERSLFERFGMDAGSVRAFLAEREPSMNALLEAFTVPHAQAAGKARWMEKSPIHLVAAARIREAYPEARIIRLVRDPRDVALSLVSAPFGGDSVIENLLTWRERDERSRAFFESDAGSLTIRFEDLVADPRGVLERVCAFIGEPFEEAMLEPVPGMRERLAAEAAWIERAGERVDPARAGRWRTELEPELAAAANALLHEALERYDYERGAGPRETLLVQPFDDALVAARRADVIALAAAGIDLRPAGTPRATLLWGRPGQLGWSLPEGRARRPLAALRIVVWMALASVRGRGPWWIPDDTGLPPRRDPASRLADLGPRLFARRTFVDELARRASR